MVAKAGIKLIDFETRRNFNPVKLDATHTRVAASARAFSPESP
jgi:hypothetical protein